MTPLDHEPRRRGRPKGTSKIDPVRFVEAALDALADGGYQALTMRGVARTVGVSLATLQHHYPTKDHLWRAAVDHVTDHVIERRSLVDPTDLAGKIAVLLEQGATRPGLLASLMLDRSSGSTDRATYLAERFGATLAEPTAQLRTLTDDGTVRHFDHRAFYALMTIGLGAISGAPEALKTLYGFDLDTEAGRCEFAAGLADIIGLGILRR